MKRSLMMAVVLLGGLAALGVAQGTIAKIYYSGKDTMVVASGGLISVLTGGTISGAGTVSISGRLDGPYPDAQVIGAGGTITADACGGVKRVYATAARTTDTTDTFTAPSASLRNCTMKVVNVGVNNITLDNNAHFKSTGAANMVLGAWDAVIVSMLNDTDSNDYWVVDGWADN